MMGSTGSTESTESPRSTPSTETNEDAKPRGLSDASPSVDDGGLRSSSNQGPVEVASIEDHEAMETSGEIEQEGEKKRISFVSGPDMLMETTASLNDSAKHPSAGQDAPRRSPRNSHNSPRTSFSSARSRRSSLHSMLSKTASVVDLAKELAYTSVIDPSLLGPLQCSAIVVNYISAGYILLPYAFSQAGLIYGTLIFSLVALQSYITTLFILESCARAESGNWVSRAGNLPRHYSMAIRQTKYELTSLQYKPPMIQTAIFSTAFQFSVPGMAGISSSKKAMTGIFKNAVSFSYTSNLVLALLVAAYFGTATNPSSNLSWATYDAGGAGWSALVSKYVLLFAALDGLAVFPLICASLGDILLAAFFADKAHLAEKDPKIRLFFRLMASVPQSIGALFVSELGIIAVYGGIFTLLSYSAAPALLYIASGKTMKEKGLSEETFYSSKWFSHTWVAYTILFTAMAIIVGVVVDSAFQGA